jgi:uncharacterized Rmd1/YagE family protein
MVTQRFLEQASVTVYALFLGQHIELSAFMRGRDEVIDPPMLIAAGSGAVVLFDYGAVVLFGLSPIEEAKFISDIKNFVKQPYEYPETERATLQREAAKSGKVENGQIFLTEFDEAQLLIVADVLAKSVVLARYEGEAAEVFDQIEPFAVSLQRPSLWQRRQGSSELLRQIGNNLLIQNKLVGQAAIIDKPEVLWEYPEFERLYLRVEDEYEIQERQSALEKKLDLVSRTVETALDLQQQTTSLRMEWYIVILIVLELLVSLYELVFR